MNKLSMSIIFFLLSICCYAGDRPTIKSLVGKRIWIEDAFAGQSFTLLKGGSNGNEEFKVLWQRHGSGVPDIRTQKFKVRLDSKYQYRFILDHPEEKNGEFVVSIFNGDKIKVYLNGIRIYADGIK